MHAGAAAEQARGKHLGVVQNQAIAWAQELGKLAKRAIFPALLGTIQHQHARSGAVVERLLRDGRLRQVIIEEGKVQFPR